MNSAKFVPTTLRVVASGIDISKDLESEQEYSIAHLLKNAYDKEKKEETPEEN